MGRRHWVGVLLAAGLIAAGTTAARRGVAAADGPATVVRAYFTALARADAPAALAAGTVPAGQHDLLTSTVLAEQQRLAPTRLVRATTVAQHARTAQVRVTYEVDAGVLQRVTESVGLTRAGGRWRLDRVAAATQLRLDRAGQRATILGGALPRGRVLLFPGAVPVRFDSLDLELDPAHSTVPFTADPTTVLSTLPSAAGRSSAVAGVTALLERCLAGHGDATCPAPPARTVPGSVRGTITDSALSVTMTNSPAGELAVSGTVTVRGSWRQLTYANLAVQRRGTTTLGVHAIAYAVSPLAFRWVAG